MMIQVVLLAALLYVASADVCGSGWTHNPQTNCCYKVLSDTLPWTMAEFKCLFQGAHTTSINSADENQFVSNLVNHREIFTGTAYFGSKTQYVNSDQTPFGQYENWESGSRPALNRARRCIKMNSSGQWFQSCCKKYATAVCKKPAPQVAQSVVANTDFRRRFRFRQ